MKEKESEEKRTEGGKGKRGRRKKEKGGDGGRDESREREMLHSILPKIFLEEEIILLKPADQISPIFWLESLHVVCILNKQRT